MRSAKSTTSSVKSKRSHSKSPSRQASSMAGKGTAAVSGGKKSAAGSAVSRTGKKSIASAKSATSIRSSLLSAKSKVDDNKPKKVIMRTPDLLELNLREEDLSFTGLTQLPSDVFEGKDIGVLDISGNNLRSIPGDIYKLAELRAINLSQNSIKCSSATDYSGLPKELTRLKKLEIIAVSECNLRIIPPVIFECVALKRLDLSRNKFQMLPPDIGNLVDLEYLNVSETSIKSLPPEIAFCERLKEVNLYGNTLELLPETMRELLELTELKLNARSFHSNIDEYMNKLLRNGQIKSEHIPNVLFDIPELRSLDLDGCRVNNLPEENSAKMEELLLSNNYFLIVPKGLITLPHLTLLDMSHNFLPSLPENIHEYLPSIKILRLNYNMLTALHANVCKLITLEVLELCNNKLSQLPASLGNLTQLRVLRAANNRLSSLPESLCKLLDLETLELTNNRLSELPVNLHQLIKIPYMHTYSHMVPVGLWLHKNPITEPPEVIWKGVEIKPLFTYLRKLKIRRTENLQPIKLFLLGEQKSGKTTLIRTLASGKCQTEEDEPEVNRNYLSANEQSNLMKRLPRDSLIEIMEEPNRTCVAAIQQWQSENAIRFCSFDMGGSDVYKILHPYFLDKCALYLLIYDHSKFDGQDESFRSQIGYWIDLLQLHIPGAVVKLVGTHTDLTATPAEESKAKVMSCVHQQLDDQKASLATELMRLKEKIAENKKLAEKGASRSATNMAEFDPQSNLIQLEYQVKQIEELMKTPLRIQPDIALVSCAEGISGITDLMSDIELMAINKELLPSGQRYIPATWKKFKMTLKKRAGFKLSWGQVKDTADKYKLHGEALTDCLEYLYNSGDIIWLETHPHLKNTVFHKPLKLIAALRGIIHHDMPNILNFDENKSFSSVGKLTRAQFNICKDRLLKYGEISRQMLLALWYYMPSGREEFLALCELMSQFELAYLIPQSDVPTSESYSEPLLVMPWFVKDEASAEETEHYWSRELSAGKREMEIVYDFTQQFPDGVFERFSAQLQGEAELRIDWANSIYIETSDANILVKRYTSETTQDIMVSIQVRSSDLRHAMRYLAKLHQTWIALLQSIPGLVWRIVSYTARKYNASDNKYGSPGVRTPASTESRPISTAQS